MPFGIYLLERYLRTPSMHSSMKVKDRVCRPSPHISNLSVAVRAFLQKAAGAFSLPPAKFDVVNESKRSDIYSLHLASPRLPFQVPKGP